MADYSRMSVEQLEEANKTLMEEKEKIREEQRQLNDVLSKKVAEESAKQLAETLSDDQKAALVQQIQAEGISSDEQVEGMGG